MAGDRLKFIIHCAQENQDAHEDCEIGKEVLNCTSAALEAMEFVTFLIVLTRVGSSLVEMVRQQSVQCVLKRVERSTVVWVKY